MADLTPFADRYMIRPHNAEQKTASGIYLPDQVQEAPCSGTIIGQGYNVPAQIKDGATAYYSRYGATEIEIAGETVVFVRAQDLIAVTE